MSPWPSSCRLTSGSRATNVSLRPNWRCLGSASGACPASDTNLADSGTVAVGVPVATDGSAGAELTGRADTDGDGERSSRRGVGGVVEPTGTGMRRAVGGVAAPTAFRAVGGVAAPAAVGVFRPDGGVVTPAKEAARRTMAGGEGAAGAAFRAVGGVAIRRGILEPLDDRERGGSGEGDSRSAGVAGGVDGGAASV